MTMSNTRGDQGSNAHFKIFDQLAMIIGTAKGEQVSNMQVIN